MEDAQGELTLTQQPHHQILEILAARALGEKDFVTAFQLADRRCRIAPPPQAHCHVLRAEAAYQIGNTPAALADLANALKISPHNVPASRRLFAWADGAGRLKAAQDLIAGDLAIGSLRAAIQELQTGGQRRWAAVSVFDAHVAGWAAWDQDAAAELTIVSDDGAITSTLEPDPFHPLSSRDVRGVAFRIPRPKSLAPQMISLALDGQRFFSQRMAANLTSSPAARAPPRRAAAPPAVPTVVVPVYADYRATRDCLASLLAADPSGARYRIMIVNDASPDTKITRFIASLAKHPHVEILANKVNLGFVGAVNRALLRLSSCDVVLLNADTIVPPGFIDRLAAIAHSSADIGTVTPLSNNGEFSSFPKPNADNPMPSRDEIIRLDQVAAACNAGAAVDIPSGIGFCLYVTRACLDAVGTLSENFQRGYLEDVDLCLRARAHGFRNVCATSVYVGHLGSRSFRTEKRSLVLRNLDVLDRRFPAYRNECAAFEAADPLQASRDAVERALPAPNHRPVLIWAGRGTAHDVAEARACALSAEGQPAILLTATPQNRIRFSAADGAAPQSVSFGSATSEDSSALRTYLGRLRPSHCEVVDPAGPPLELAAVFGDLDIPHDLWIADAHTLAPGRQPLERARRILVPCAMAKALVQRTRLDLRPQLLALPAPALVLSRQAGAPPTATTLAIVPTKVSVGEWRAIRAIALALRRRRSDVAVVVAGSTVDDLRVMSLGNVHVTGPVALSELSDVLQPYEIGWMLTGFDGAVFGHPHIQAARNADVPVAYLDWSQGAITPRKRDLAIAPDAGVDHLSGAVVAWIERG